jgi:tripartite-type tricarboxylate transporter receptor subunit TctC
LFIRALQPLLQKALGSPVVVENMPGASGRVAATAVWKTEADGYTLLSHAMPMTTIGEILYKVDYKILEMEHIVAFDLAPYVLIVKKNSPYNSLRDIVEATKTKSMTNSTSGVGGAMHLQSVVMKDQLGIKYDDIPFNGSSPAMTAVMASDVDFSIEPFDIPLTNLGEVKVISVFSPLRLPQYPDVPTATEENLPFTYLSIRRAISAPKGTPKEVCDILIKAFRETIEDPEYQKWAQERGVTMDPLYGDEYLAVDKEAYDLVMELKPLLEAK